ncbi:unnamed protein product [Brassicogethes aeneus]|uniref:Uncharacterized protein n=1 Tax=Brassicogethes aeneus TaxID=1431903 RepID=A0A9P0BCH0_BRAAE|nr:unnamed protein product [Brassicogethes aeneus]
MLEQNMSIKSVVVDFLTPPLASRSLKNLTKIRNFRTPVNDVVSKNITMVLENLLKNYESSQLPTHGKESSDSELSEMILNRSKQKEAKQMQSTLLNLASACDKTGVSDRSAAIIVNAALLHLNIISKEE